MPSVEFLLGTQNDDLCAKSPSLQKSEKLHGARSGECGGWGMVGIWFSPQAFRDVNIKSGIQSSSGSDKRQLHGTQVVGKSDQHDLLMRFHDW